MASYGVFRPESKWKKVKIDANHYSGSKNSDLLAFEELSDYNIISSGSQLDEDGKSATDDDPQHQISKKKKRKPKSKKKLNTEESQEDTTTKKKLESSEKSSSQKSKKNKNVRVEESQEDIIPKPKKKKKNKKKQKKSNFIIGNSISDITEITDSYSGEREKVKESKNKKSKKIKDKDSDDKPKKKKKKQKEQKKVSVQDEAEENKKIAPKKAPDMSAWKDLFVPADVLKALSEQGFRNPTPIQTLALPSAIRDKQDIIGAAQTGSGKTLAFGIPLLNAIMNIKQSMIDHPNGEDEEHEEKDDDDDSELSEDLPADFADYEDHAEEMEDEEGEQSDENDEEEDEDDEDDDFDDVLMNAITGSSDEEIEGEEEEGKDDDSDVNEDDPESDNEDDPDSDNEELEEDGVEVVDEDDWEEVDESLLEPITEEDLAEGSDEEEEGQNDDDDEEEEDEDEDKDDLDASDEEEDEEDIEEVDESEWKNVTPPEDMLEGDGSDGDYDLPPDEDETWEDVEGDGTGCVFAHNNVKFDWEEEEEETKGKTRKSTAVERPLLALILTPTRELAIQVKDHIDNAAIYTGITTTVVVGGMAAQKQERLLKKGPEIVIATPGRLWELIQEGNPHLSKVEDIRLLVIDEADRMVEKGHFQELSSLLTMINSNEEKKRRRQTFIFSATLTMVHSGPERVKLKKNKKKYKITEEQKLDALISEIGIKDKPKVIDLSGKQMTAQQLTETRINCTATEKDLFVYYLLQHYPGRTLVFTNSKDCLRRVTTICTLLQCNPLPLHADMHQRQRLKNLDKFKANSRGLLLATDVAARGLDIPNVRHVIHYQVPRTTENYVHRSGRTARADKEGLSVMLVSPSDLKNYRKIIKTLNRDEDVPIFPVDPDYLPALKERLSLACQIDKLEHSENKQKAENQWFIRSAQEMDMEIDERITIHDLGDSFEQKRSRQKLGSMRQELSYMLRQPLSQAGRSGKYPTKTGKLVVPFLTGFSERNAVARVKQDIKKSAPKEPQAAEPEPEASTGKKRKRKSRAWILKKKKLNQEQNAD